MRDDVRGLVESVAARWRAVFPSEQGYELAVSSPAGTSNGARLTVSRGDFRAGVSIESILDPNRKSHAELAIRMFGRAESRRTTALEREAQATITRCRAVGICCGLAVFSMALWFAFGVAAPIYVLGGLLMVVSALLTTTLGGTAGAFAGERLVAKARTRAVSESARDPKFQEALRRWRALTRELSSQRQALTGQVGAAPFRALRAAPERTTGSNRMLPRLATSFSFSS